jgi:hypothetical protein
VSVGPTHCIGNDRMFTEQNGNHCKNIPWAVQGTAGAHMEEDERTVRIKRGNALEQAARTCVARLSAASAILHRAEATMYTSSSHILPAAAAIAPHAKIAPQQLHSTPPPRGLGTLTHRASPNVDSTARHVDTAIHRLHPGVQGCTSVAVATSADGRTATVTVQAAAQVTDCDGEHNGDDEECLVAWDTGSTEDDAGSIAVAFAAVAAAQAAGRCSQCAAFDVPPSRIFQSIGRLGGCLGPKP